MGGVSAATLHAFIGEKTNRERKERQWTEKELEYK
jgi:hypothetical protein